MANLTPFKAPIPAILHFELIGFNHEKKKKKKNQQTSLRPLIEFRLFKKKKVTSSEYGVYK